MLEFLCGDCQVFGKSLGKLLKEKVLKVEKLPGVLILFLFLFFPLLVSSTNYYVSSSGNDSNPGTR